MGHGTSTLERAIEIRHWVRMQQPDGESWKPHKIALSERLFGDTDDPFSILRAQRRGAPAVCRQFAYLMVGAAESTGIRARVIIVARTFWKSYEDGHVMAEVWIPELSKWILMDPMFDLLYEVDRLPASALDVYTAVHLGKTDSVSVVKYGGGFAVLDRALLKRRFTHLYIALTNGLFDGYRVCTFCEKPIAFAHFSNRESPPYPVLLKFLGLFCGIMSLLGGVILSLKVVRQSSFIRGLSLSTTLSRKRCESVLASAFRSPA